MFFHYVFKFGGKRQNSPVDFSKLLCYKTDLLVYCYSFDNGRIKSLVSSQDQCSLITADGIRPCVSGCLLRPVGWHLWVNGVDQAFSS